MMWPEPDDPEVARRMRAAHRHARDVMGLHSDASLAEAWGWRGRTLSQAVIAPDGPAWLRVACAPVGQVVSTFWSGSSDAEISMPGSIPRPHLRSWVDWNDEQWRYRAELYDRVTGAPVATSPVLTTTPTLPPEWWAAVSAALADITQVPTRRYTVNQGFLDWAMPQLLGTPVETTSPRPWTTAHGDFHFANLCAPDLQILDFEGWGLAPAGYDAATLHTYSLLSTPVSDRVRAELGHVLDTPSGRFAELVIITELLHAARRGDNLVLHEPLHQRAALLLGRSTPRTRRSPSDEAATAATGT